MRESAFRDEQRIHRVSEPRKIGKHEWRLVVYERKKGRGFRDKQIFTGYEWRPVATAYSPVDGEPWLRDVDWPRYDMNHTFEGMPKSLTHLFHACPWASGEAIRELEGKVKRQRIFENRYVRAMRYLDLERVTQGGRRS